MNLGISFAPLVPPYVVWAAFAVAALISIALLLARSRGAPLRALALALMVLALANPSLTREDREPIPSVAAVIVDKSPSQSFGDRAQQTEAARATLVERLKRIPGLKCAWRKPVRRMEKPTGPSCLRPFPPRSPTFRLTASPAPS